MSTVRATVTQFNSVVSCVITPCLGNLSMTARDRARVVEHGIKVAWVCYGRAKGVPIRSLEKSLYFFISSQE